MTTETITWSGEEWEVIHSSINLGTLKEYANVTLRRKPKPLREEFVVYDASGKKWRTLETKSEAMAEIRLRASRETIAEWRIEHMREVRKDGEGL